MHSFSSRFSECVRCYTATDISMTNCSRPLKNVGNRLPTRAPLRTLGYSSFNVHGLPRLRRVHGFMWCQTEIRSKSRVITHLPPGHEEVVNTTLSQSTVTLKIAYKARWHSFDHFLGIYLPGLRAGELYRPQDDSCCGSRVTTKYHKAKYFGKLPRNMKKAHNCLHTRQHCSAPPPDDITSHLHTKA